MLVTAPSGENLIGRFRHQIGDRRFERGEAVAWITSTGRGAPRASRLFRFWLKLDLVRQVDPNGYRFSRSDSEPPEARTLRWIGRPKRLAGLEPGQLELVRKAAVALVTQVEAEIARR